MTLAILGNGALGRSLADLFAPARPMLVGRRRAAPFQVIGRGAPHLATPAGLGWDEQPPTAVDVVLVAVKWAALPLAAAWIQRHASAALVVTFLNGLGQEEALAGAVASPNLSPAITTHACTRLDADPPGVRIASEGETWLTEQPHPADAELRNWASRLNLPWQWLPASRMIRYRWRKLVQNSIINPLSVLADAENGRLPDLVLWRLTPVLYDEAAAVARAEHVTLPPDTWPSVTALARATASNHSSMLQDVHRGLPTEIDAITGYLLRTAKRHRLPAPTHDALYRLVLGIADASEHRPDPGDIRTPNSGY